MQTGAGNLIGHLGAGDDAQIVAGDDLIGSADADGEGTAMQQVFCGLVVIRDADGDLIFFRDAASGSIHAVDAITVQNKIIFFCA